MSKGNSDGNCSVPKVFQEDPKLVTGHAGWKSWASNLIISNGGPSPDSESVLGYFSFPLAPTAGDRKSGYRAVLPFLRTNSLGSPAVSLGVVSDGPYTRAHRPTVPASYPPIVVRRTTFDGLVSPPTRLTVLLPSYPPRLRLGTPARGPGR